MATMNNPEMDQPPPDPPATQTDVILAVLALVFAIAVTTLAQSCRSDRHYDDLRERLERIEQRRR